MHKIITINVEVLVQLCYSKYSVNNENTIKGGYEYEEIYKNLCICNGIDDGIRTSGSGKCSGKRSSAGCKSRVGASNSTGGYIYT